jgi:vancomycin resistance protein YoaR
MRNQIVSTGAGIDQPRRRARRFRRRPGIVGLLEWLLVLFSFGAIAAAIVTMALILLERDFALRLYPNMSVRGVQIGGLRVNAAETTLLRAHRSFLTNPVAIQYGAQSWRPSAADLGITLDFTSALNEAYAFGRGATRLENLRTASAIWEEGVDLPLTLQVDQTVMQTYLLAIAAAVDTPPQNADLRLDGPNVIVTPERWGTQVLVDEMLAELTAAAQSLTPQTIPLRTRQLEPTIRDTAVAPIVAELETLLAGPIVLSSAEAGCARGCRWDWSLHQIAGWISLERTGPHPERPLYTVSIDQNAIRSALLPIAGAVRQEGTLPRVAWNNGNLLITQPGQNGLGLDANATMSQIDAALAGESRTIELPLGAIPPPVTERNLAALGIVGQVGAGVSSFANSEQYRITNIRAGARQMNGLLIPPGGAFSFNDNLGPVTAERGFAEGYAIINNRTQKEWGGGLCQVSTTVFRAAFWGGLPITERHEHSFRIGWYEELGEPPGLDAAIFTGVYDLRFVNDSPNWLLMESYVDLEGQRLSIALYGTPTGRSVTMSHEILERTPAPTEPVYVDDPEAPRGSVRQSDTSRGGLRVNVYRTIRQNDAVLASDTFYTEFKPWPDIFVRGPR